MDEAFELAHRVAILNEGRIEQIGTPREILQRPATEFVAKFVDGIVWRGGEAVRPVMGESLTSAPLADLSMSA
jgi:ABC-type proline/glycine betaine transport system ATPase subunit